MPFKDKEKQKEYNREYQRNWRNKNRVKIRDYQRKRYWIHHDKIRKRKNNANKINEQTYEVRARRYHRIRIQILKNYSTKIPKCKNCGEKRYECLQIDHINNDGNKERKKISSGENFYYWLIKQPIRKDKYQVLCANCNVIKRLRELVSYQQEFKNIKEWEAWSKCKTIKTPKKLKKLWQQKREYY